MTKYVFILCVAALTLACNRDERGMPAAASESDQPPRDSTDRRATTPITPSGDNARNTQDNDPSGVAAPVIPGTDRGDRAADIERATDNIRGIAPGDPNNDMARDMDNTARNERDQNSNTQTPLDQGNGESDLRITKQIRQAIVAHDGLSFEAKNVKVITEAGRVTLRGPVETAEERRLIGRIALDAAGAGRVDNELEVETNP